MCCLHLELLQSGEWGKGEGDEGEWDGGGEWEGEGGSVGGGIYTSNQVMESILWRQFLTRNKEK